MPHLLSRGAVLWSSKKRRRSSAGESPLPREMLPPCDKGRAKIQLKPGARYEAGQSRPAIDALALLDGALCAFQCAISDRRAIQVGSLRKALKSLESCGKLWLVWAHDLDSHACAIGACLGGDAKALERARANVMRGRCRFRPRVEDPADGDCARAEKIEKKLAFPRVRSGD